MKKVSLKINGVKHQLAVGPDLVLLDWLRDGLGLTGAKQSCDRSGQCGACTVIVDGKAARSCLKKMADLDGAEVITVEGLGTPDNPHLIQEAFVLAGAVQCGFCTPGMIMSAKALLDKDPAPSREAMKKAFARNLCRCTGYKKIFEAVELAAKFISGETTPDAVRPAADAQVMGVSHPRPTAMAKACGEARFSADIKIPGAAELVVVRSDVPHAAIKALDTSEAEAMPGVVAVLTAKDIKGTNRLKYMVDDRPVLCEDKVRYIGDPVAAVVAETIEQARAAAAKVRLELAPLPEVKTPQESLAEGATAVHGDRPNLAMEQPQIKGDADAALAGSAGRIKATFKTQVNHQAPLEPEVTVAYWEDEDEEEPKLVIVGRSINIHYHLGMLQAALGWDNMRYEEAFVGGQFGIKIDVITEGLAGAAALATRRAVRYVPSLAESFRAASKRHPFYMDVELAADADGKLTAYCNDFLVDNGAYHSMGNVVLTRALLMLSGSYDIPNVKARGRLAYTTNPWGSAARGAGPPQANFALEVAVDMLANEMGQDPFDFRVKNFLAPGGTRSTGVPVDVWPMDGLMEAIKPHYEEAKAWAAQAGEGKIKRGVGLGTGSFGIGGPGDAGNVAVELLEDGCVGIFAAVADPGEGNDSMLTQLTAEFMGMPMSMVRLNTRNTDMTTATGPAAGSRMTYMIGGALLNALGQLKEAMAETGATNAAELEAAGKPKRYLGQKKNAATALDPATGQGASFESQVHAVQMALVEVDSETGAAKVVRMVCAVDAGPVINPDNLTGQLEGGMDMGVGYALREEYVAGKTKDWVTFKFPTIGMSFDTEVIVRETPRPHGPMGATGVGEMCMVPTAPAVINAIHNACGVWVTNLPATPDKVKAAMEAAA